MTVCDTIYYNQSRCLVSLPGLMNKTRDDDASCCAAPVACLSLAGKNHQSQEGENQGSRLSNSHFSNGCSHLLITLPPSPTEQRGLEGHFVGEGPAEIKHTNQHLHCSEQKH